MKSRHLPFYTKHLSFFNLHLIYIHASKSFSTQTCCYSVNIIFDHLITVIPPSALDDKIKRTIWITSSAIMRMRWPTRRRPINCRTFIPPQSPAWIRPWSRGTARESTPVTAVKVSSLSHDGPIFIHLLTASVKHDLMLLRRCLHPSGRWDCATPSRVA